MFKKSKAKSDINGTKPRLSPHHVRAALMSRGFTMKAWAKKRGYPYTTVWHACYTLRAGKMARRIQAELEQLLDA
ncbi:MAG TPA: hypothetical protein VGY56_10590 [Verrucomicrobiae bacterium]|nr:hypothetical protein [Verrucomicrobiae bacterium]